MLIDAAAQTGGIATQNRGTIGGNIANASPAADTPPALLVYDAELELVSPRPAASLRGVPRATRQMDLGARRDHRLRLLPEPGTDGSRRTGRWAPGARRRSRRCALPRLSGWTVVGSPTPASRSGAWRRRSCGAGRVESLLAGHAPSARAAVL
jgi:hypothetical protein